MGIFNRSSGNDDESISTGYKPGFQLKLPRQASTLAPEDIYTNADLDPTPPERRTWGIFTWCSFWVAASLDPAFFALGSSLIPLGLSVPNAIGIIVLGNVLVSIPIVANGAVGSYMRVPFPIAIRASMGYYFSFFAVVSRLFLALIWFGVETYNGGLAMTSFLSAIWPSYLDVANTIPESAGITTVDMVSYFLFWLIQLPFFFINSNHLRYAFILKVFVVPATAIAMTVSIAKDAGGSGPLVAAPSTVSGSAFSLAWLSGLAAVMGNWSTLALNSPDFARYSKRPNSQLVQAIAIPATAVFIAVCGIICASASVVVYGGDALWTPMEIMNKWDNRAARAFAALAWMLATSTANITANSIAAANDLVTLCPQYINLTRGQVMTAFLGGWAVAPWKILASSSSFLTFCGGYSIVLGPLAALLTCDYFFVKQRAYHVPELYDPQGIYRYNSGLNWRALATVVVFVSILLPGWINAMNPDIDVGNAVWVYAPGLITSYFPAVLFYYLLNLAFPHYASLVAEAVTADDVDQSVGTDYDKSSEQEHDLSKETYNMGELPQQHA
ncbi:uncharacterized protein JCM6883_003808 [Sporobolomyces salmoneus]|uniref:uncharacterized protein n=1 Tax=Sporobolomyces salmoneus TaxID=183962 RepID=UPI0031718D70